jgi:TolB protein
MTRVTYYDVYSRTADGCRERQLTDTPGLSNTGPRLSPDGSTIVFSSARDGDAEIFVMNAADGTAARQVTHNNLPDIEPDWSPDRSGRIVFASLRNNVFGLYVVDANGTNEQVLTAQGDRQPDWSTQGRIAFVSTRNNLNRVFTMNGDGSNQQPVTGSGHYTHPVWSPDGTRLGYSAPGEVWVDDGPGGGAPPRLVFSRSAEGPAWSPDGRWLALVTYENQQHTVLHVGADGKGEGIDFVGGTDPIIDVEWAPH